MRQVDNLAPRVESMTEKVAMYDDYLQYDANWHRDINLHGAERAGSSRRRSTFRFSHSCGNASRQGISDNECDQ